MGEPRWRDQRSPGPTFWSLSATSRMTRKERYKATKSQSERPEVTISLLIFSCGDGSIFKVSQENLSSSLRSLERWQSHFVQPQKVTTGIDLIDHLAKSTFPFKIQGTEAQRNRDMSKVTQAMSARVGPNPGPGWKSPHRLSSSAICVWCHHVL